MGTRGKTEVLEKQGGIDASAAALLAREREIAQDAINVAANQEKVDAANRLRQRQAQWDSNASTYLNPATRWAGYTYDQQKQQAIKNLGPRPT